MAPCCAYKCQNVATHYFPKDPKRRKEWEKALRLKNFKATKNSKLCSKHFKPEDYFGQSIYCNYAPLKQVLRKTAVPSIFTCMPPRQIPSKQENQIAVSRQQRLERRNKKKLLAKKGKTQNNNTQPKGNQSILEAATSTQQHATSVNNKTVKINKVKTVSNAITKPLPKSSGNSSVGTQVNIKHVFKNINIHKYRNDDKLIKYYTGFENYRKLFLVYSTLIPMVDKIKYYDNMNVSLSAEDQFFLTLIKLRQNYSMFHLSQFFSISKAMASNIFITWVHFIYQLWSTLKIWPSKDLIQYYMPEQFRNYDNQTRVILDTVEISTQISRHPSAQQVSQSSCKHSNTLKLLVGATPGGLLSFCSPAYAGHVSDGQAVERSPLLTILDPGDCVIADRAFKIQDKFSNKNITVNTTLKDKSQLPTITVLKDRKITNKKVHIKQIIDLTETYKILNGRLHHNYIPIASKIFFICMMCCNFRECKVKK